MQCGAEHGTERHRAPDDADLRAVAPEPLDDEHDEQHHEATLCDLRDATDRDHAAQHRAAIDLLQPRADRMRIIGLAVGVGDGIGVGTHEGDRERDGEEADEVDEHDRAQARHGDEQAAQRRADEPRQARAGGECGVGRGELLARHHPRDEGDVGGVVELGQQRLTDDRDVCRPHAIGPHGEQRQQHRRLGEVGRDQAATQVPPVDEASAERPEQGGDDELAQEHDRGRRAGARFGEDVHREPDDQHPVARVVDQSARPRQAEVAAAPHRRHVAHDWSGRGKASNAMWTVLADLAAAALDARRGGVASRSSIWRASSASSAACQRELVGRELGRVLPLAGQVGDRFDELAGEPLVLDPVGAEHRCEHGALFGRGVAQRPRAEREADRRRPPATHPAVDGCVAGGVVALDEPEPLQLAQVVAAGRGRGADDRGAVRRRPRWPRHQQLEDRRPLRMGECPHRIEIGDDASTGLRSDLTRHDAPSKSEGNPSHLRLYAQSGEM